MNRQSPILPPKALLGMIHVGALPGTPREDAPLSEVIKQAAAEARLLINAGFDGLIIENMHDAPYLRREVGPEIVSAMTAVGAAVREAMPEDKSLGVQILAGANRAALAVAQAVGAQFIRAEGFVFASVADEGLMDEADAGPLLRYRKLIGADDIRIFVDVKKKHASHAITADLDVSQTTKAAEFFGADGVIITGIATGQAIKINDLGTARVATTLPLLVGSGVTPESVKDLFAYADGLIVGSWYKRDGLWSNPPDAKRAKQLVDSVKHALI